MVYVTMHATVRVVLHLKEKSIYILIHVKYYIKNSFFTMASSELKISFASSGMEFIV